MSEVTKGVSAIKKVPTVIPLSVLPRGEHEGIWGGYKVWFTVDGVEYELETVNGVRSPSEPCIIHVYGDNVTVELK
jgi:hypothetical protein